jgi:hypothetical protein
MATEDSSNTTPAPQTSPEALCALAERSRGYAITIRNPTAKAGLVADLSAGAQVMDGLLQLYADAISGKPHDIVRAVRDLVAGNAPVPIALTLPRAEATALAQFLKRIGFEDVAKFTSATVTYNGLAEGEVIWSGVLMLQRALADAGYAPR